MTRSTHLPSPTAAELSDLLQRTGWSAYRAAQIIGLTARAVQQAVTGERRMTGSHWQLLRIYASQAVRDSLPAAVESSISTLPNRTGRILRISTVRFCPIATAPRDGEEVIVGKWHAGVWLTHGARWVRGDEWQPPDDPPESDGWWSYCNSVSQERIEGIFEPTHWAPMPELPPET